MLKNDIGDIDIGRKKHIRVIRYIDTIHFRCRSFEIHKAEHHEESAASMQIAL